MVEQALVDEEAIINAAKTNSDAFGKLYEQYQQRVFSYVLYRVTDAQTADDLTAQIFERALRKIATYQPSRGTFVVWLFTIARNVVNNHLRAKRLRQWVTLDLFSNHSAETMSLEELVCQDEQVQQLLALVEQSRARSAGAQIWRRVDQSPHCRAIRVEGKQHRCDGLSHDPQVT